MMNYFRDGGFTMWIILLGAVLTFVVAAVKDRESRPVVFTVGCIFSLIAGMMGLSLGMVAVSHYFQRVQAPAAVVAQGLGELSNNGSFAATLALVQGVAALISAWSVAKQQRS